MRKFVFLGSLFLCCVSSHSILRAQKLPGDFCPRPSIGGVVPEPEDLRSRNGVLAVDLTVRNQKQNDGSIRYCYIYGNGVESPTLRLKPGDLLILKLKNELIDPEHSPAPIPHHHAKI